MLRTSNSLKAASIIAAAELDRISQAVVFTPPTVDAVDVLFRQKPIAHHLTMRAREVAHHEPSTLLFGDLDGG